MTILHLHAGIFAETERANAGCTSWVLAKAERGFELALETAPGLFSNSGRALALPATDAAVLGTAVRAVDVTHRTRSMSRIERRIAKQHATFLTDLR